LVELVEAAPSEEFYREILNHPIPTDLDAAKALSSSPAALDLFMWLAYHCFTARGRERVPLFGDFGLISQLGSAEYARPQKFDAHGDHRTRGGAILSIADPNVSGVENTIARPLTRRIRRVE
jgi:hypothetical protein